jgi:hypothetical protein
MDAEHSELAIDAYGRKYTTIWPAIANKNGNTWSKFGDKSTADKYLGFYYNFHWYADDILIAMDKVRVILTNDSCHNDLVPDVVARRIDTKVLEVTTTVNNINQQITNIKETYVTNEVLENNYISIDQGVTKDNVVELVTDEVNTIVTETIEAKVAETIQEKVDSGEIAVKANSVSYDMF